MLREEQIEVRKRRAAAEPFQIHNLGRNRVFSDYQVANPEVRRPVSRQHPRLRRRRQHLRLSRLQDQHPRHLQAHRGRPRHLQGRRPAAAPPAQGRRHAPRVFLQYGEQLRLGLHLPPRHSDQLTVLAETFFDPRGLWKAGDRYDHLIDALADVPEHVTISSDAMEFMTREIERRDMARRERGAARQARTRRDRSGPGEPADRAAVSLPDARRPVRRLSRPVHPRRRHGPRQNGPDAGRRRVAGPRARHRARPRRRPGLGQVPVGKRNPQVHRPHGAGHRGHHAAAARAVQPADVLPARQLRDRPCATSTS